MGIFAFLVLAVRTVLTVTLDALLIRTCLVLYHPHPRRLPGSPVASDVRVGTWRRSVARARFESALPWVLAAIVFALVIATGSRVLLPGVTVFIVLRAFVHMHAALACLSAGFVALLHFLLQLTGLIP